MYSDESRSHFAMYASRLIWPLAGAVVIAAADQAIKAIVLATRPHVTVIPGFLALTFATNTGAAFSIFQGYPRALTVVGILVLAMLLGYLWHTGGRGSRLELAAVSLLIGGAIGNLVDRFRLGYVVDYIDIFIGAYHWPTFNLADSAVSGGVICLLLLSLRGYQTPAGSPPTVQARMDDP